MNSTHHAELVRSNSVKTCLLSCVHVGSEVSEMSSEKFGIDDARELVRLAHNRPVQTKEQTLVIRTEFITHEAQNALLKVLEEPPISTKFVFVVPVDFHFLPTLKSRLNESKFDILEEDLESTQVFEQFVNLTYQERLNAVEKALKNKDINWQRQIKKGLIYQLKNSHKKDKALESLEFVTRTLLTRGASNKMLLEHAALII
ncbi:hypothetical protein H6785_00040 [Candidatus Nomurabacteria bacterium]|nr:hypothetical protein [Candidatus Kaiserbacteria bacterium]MCB9814962.1 hypothetical protein [Candidatus Nomurabacteria bacterium]